MERRYFLLSSMLFGFGATARLKASGLNEALTGDRFLVGPQESRLADIIAPPLDAPFGKEARKVLQGLLSDSASIELERHFIDRWGRYVGYLLINGMSCQEKLVRAGVVRVNPESEDYKKISMLLSAERSARRAARGLWAEGPYKVRDAYFDAIPVGTYCLVAGRINDARARGTRFYLNFGEDWRTDFTVSVGKQKLASWKFDPSQWEDLSGQNILVRGYIEKINGPSIDLLHPMQLDFFKGEKSMPLFSFAPETPQAPQEHFPDHDL